MKTTSAAVVLGSPWAVMVISLAVLAGCAMNQKSDAKETFTQQAAAGGTLYGAHCSKCHGDSGQGTDQGPRVVGLKDGALPLDPPSSRQVRKSRFVTVADVAAFAVKNMPKDDPGSLSEADYWRILAFDLKANGIDLKDQTLDGTLAATLTIPR